MGLRQKNSLESWFYYSTFYGVEMSLCHTIAALLLYCSNMTTKIHKKHSQQFSATDLSGFTTHKLCRVQVTSFSVQGFFSQLWSTASKQAVMAHFDDTRVFFPSLTCGLCPYQVCVKWIFLLFIGRQGCDHKGCQLAPVFICWAICRLWNAEGEGERSQGNLAWLRAMYLLFPGLGLGFE